MPDPEEPIGVVIIDDHQMFAESLARLLVDVGGIEVLGLASTGAAGIELTARVKPRVVLVDYQMPEQDGVEVAAQITSGQPDVMVVMLTGSTDDRVLLAAIDAGCCGFLTKDRAAVEVTHAVRTAAAGEALISPAMLARLLPKLSRTQHQLGEDLTDREREILGFLALGWTTRVIATHVHLSVNTVRNYAQGVLSKLGAHSQLEAVATAVREGIINYPAAKR